MIRKLLTTVIALPLLAGCGDGGTETTLEDGTSIRADASGAGLAAPSNLPDFAPLYPGARVDNVVLDPRSPGKGMVAYTVQAKVDDVFAFYKDKGTGAGLKSVQETSQSGSRMLAMTATDSNAADTGMQVNVMPSFEGNGQVTVSLVFSGKAGS